MKRFIIPLILMLSFPVAGVAGDKGVAETAEAFFTAIKAGDVDALRNMIEAPLSDQIDNLLTNNAAYPEYLRTRYRGASAEVGEITRFKKNEKQVDLVVTFPDGRVSLIELTISKRKSPQWKVTEQRKVIE